MRNANIGISSSLFPINSKSSSQTPQTIRKNPPGPSSLILFPMEKEALILYNMNTRN